jgi:capsular exopolysaccharide synthesis family protein
MDESQFADPYVTTGAEFSIRHHLDVIRGRFWTISACAVVLFSIAAIYTFRATPIYESSARLLIERRLPLASPFAQGQEQRDQEYFATQVNLITSRPVLDKALEREGLARVFEVQSDRETARPGLWGSALRELRTVFAGEASRQEEPWEQLKKAVQLRPVKETDLVDVIVRGSDPKLSALAANSVAEAYVAHSVAARQESAGQAFNILQQQMKEQEKALKKAEDDLLSYREQATIPELGSPGEQSNLSPVMERRRALNDEYTKVQLRRIELAVAAGAIQKAEGEGHDPDSLLGVNLIANAPAVVDLYGRLVQAELSLETTLRACGEKHPDVLALKEQIGQLEGELQKAALRAANSIRAEHEMLVAREQELMRAVAEESQLALDQARKSHVFGRLDKDAARQAHVFDVIVDRMKEVGLTRDAGITNVTLVERATPSQRPVSPNKPRALILGALLGILVGLGAAYAFEHLDDTVKTPDDVEKGLNVPWLGYVPRLETAAGELDGLAGLAQYSLTHPSSSGTEAFRSIRTNVYFSGTRGQVKSLMVTSAAPQDGKSVFAANLAVTVAQDGKRVLLVDADLRRPTLHEAFGLRKSPGLTNMLVEGTPLDKMIQTPSDGGNGKLDSLHILCAGAKSPNPAELLGGDAMAKFIHQARARYDMVIFDSCPAMFLADSAGLASGCDGVVMVLKAAKTRREAAVRARKQLQAVHGKVIGVVLNQVRPKSLRYYSSYGYYYYDYQRYYKDDGEGEPGADAPPARSSAGAPANVGKGGERTGPAGRDEVQA